MDTFSLENIDEVNNSLTFGLTVAFLNIPNLGFENPTAIGKKEKTPETPMANFCLSLLAEKTMNGN